MPTSIYGVKHVIAVASGKGGVGKSCTAMNMAVALGQQGLKVGLLDADIYGPSQPQMMGISAEDMPTSPDGNHIKPAEKHGIKMMSMGFLVEGDTPIVWRGPMVLSALKQMLFQTEWAPLDVLVLDMPPGTGDVQLSIAQQVGLSGAVIVSTPQDIALLDARKGLNMFKKVNVPILGMIENMSTFICPHCSHESHIFSHGGAAKAAQELETDLLAEIPLDIEIRMNSDTGLPVVLSMSHMPQAKVYMDLAAKIREKLEALDKPKPVKIVFEGEARAPANA